MRCEGRTVVHNGYPPKGLLPASEDYSARIATMGTVGAVDTQRLASRELLRNPPAPKLVLQWTFWLVVLAIPFESMDLGLGHGTASLPKLLGYLLVPLAFMQPRVCFRSVPRAFWGFALYLAAYLVLGILGNGQYWPPMIARLLTLCQMLMFFWIAYNLMRSDRIIRGTLLALAASCSVFALFQLFGVASEELVVYGGERIKTLDTNPNTAGATYALGLLALMGYAYGQRERGGKVWLLSGPLFVLMATQLVRTGSRTASLALAVGLLAFLLGPGSWSLRSRRTVIAFVAIGAFLWISSRSKVLEARWEVTVSRGKLADRERIFPAAWKMFLERPLAGWGPVRNIVELGSRLRTPGGMRGTHNLYLWVLTETGLLGAIPFFVGLWLCVWAAWRARRGLHGMLPLAWMLALLAVDTTGDWYNRKLHWLVLAYALAAGSHFTARRRRGAVAAARLPADRQPEIVGVSRAGAPIGRIRGGHDPA
jgi:O-antigen ligase